MVKFGKQIQNFSKKHSVDKIFMLNYKELKQYIKQQKAKGENHESFLHLINKGVTYVRLFYHQKATEVNLSFSLLKQSFSFK